MEFSKHVERFLQTLFRKHLKSTKNPPWGPHFGTIWSLGACPGSPWDPSWAGDLKKLKKCPQVSPKWAPNWHQNSPKSRKVRLWKPTWKHLRKSHRKKQIRTSSKSLKLCFRTRGVAKMNKSRFPKKVSNFRKKRVMSRF